MKKLVVYSLSAFILSCASLKQAPSTLPKQALGALPATESNLNKIGSIDVDGVNVRPLVDFLERYTYKLSRSIFVYLWSHQDSEPLLSDSALKQVSFDYIDHSTFSAGPHMALDPVATRHQGGISWKVTQLELPDGFRFLNLVKDQRVTYDEKTSKIWQALGCHIPESLASTITEQAEASTRCKSAFQKIFAELLKIDGYTSDSYSADFAECPSGDPDPSTGKRTDRNLEFVIAGNRWLKPKFVKTFTMQSRSDKKDRLRIQTLFYKSAQDHKPEITLLQIPAVMTDRSPIQTNASMAHTKNLLWTDLEGAKPDAQVNSWVAHHLFGCGQISYFDNN